MRRTRLRIVYVGRGRALPRGFSNILERAGYVVSRVKRGAKDSELSVPKALQALVTEGLNAEEVRAALAPRRSGMARPRAAVFTAEFTLFGNQIRKSSLGSARPRSPRVIPMTLQALRESAGRTQGEVARRVGMTQPQLSRVEARHDHLISTLRKYVRALGGKIEVAVHVKGTRIVLQDV
jgi:hypothetical protein